MFGTRISYKFVQEVRLLFLLFTSNGILAQLICFSCSISEVGGEKRSGEDAPTRNPSPAPSTGTACMTR